MVSVIIPNWNGKHLLKSCLAHLKKQTYNDFEIILVDNGSVDGSIEFVKELFPDVHIVSLNCNKGFAGGANEGIRMARGEFVVLLNNDAMADDRWVEELVKGIDSSPEIGFCASKILRLPDRGRVDTAGDCYTRFGVARKRGWNENADGFLETELVFGACAAAALYRKSMLEEIGLFDEDFFCLYEDVDLSFRAQLAGYKCLYVPTAIVYHLGGGTTESYRDFNLYYGQRNMEWVFLKNMPLSLLIKYLPLHFGYILLAFGYHLFRNKGGVFLRSKLDAARGVGSIIQKRRVVQRKRKVSSQYLEKMFHTCFLNRTAGGN